MEIINLSISSFDRMFPNQDFLPKGDYGNLIALPFQKEPSKYGNTLLVDRNFMPIQNPIQYLSTIHKLSMQEVLQSIEKISGETIDVGHEILNVQEELVIKNNNLRADSTIC